MLRSTILAASLFISMPAVAQDYRVIFTINNALGINLYPSINAQGHVVFASNGGNDVWTDASGSLQRVASNSMTAPGSASNYWWGQSDHSCQISDADAVVVPAFLIPGQGIWSGASAPLNTQFITPTTSAAFPGGLSLGSIDDDRVLVNSSLRIVFNGALSGSGVNSNNTNALIAVQNQQFSMIARAGDAAPGFPTGAVYGADCFNPGSGFYSMNDGSDVCFSGSATQVPGGSYLGQALWLNHNGVTSLIAKRGNSVPGSATLTILDAGRPSLNNAGDVLFQADLSNASFGLLLKPNGGSLQTIGKTGDAAPGTGETFRFFSRSAINHSGQVAFQAQLTGASISSDNDQVVYTKTPGGSLIKLLREKDPLPGGLTGERVYTDTASELTPIMNANGYTVLLTKIAGSPVSGRSTAITVFDSTGNLSRLICSGDSIEVSPGNFQTINFLSICAGDFGRLYNLGTGGEDGFRSPLNDSNELTFFARFNNGTSGIVVTTVPEPSGILLAIGFACAARRRKVRD